MAGLRKNVSQTELYKELLQGSIPCGVWVCVPDGASNFSIVFARERKCGTVQTFFVALNLKVGPIACFGFNELAKSDFDEVLNRFFKNTDSAMLDVEVGVKILNENTEKALQMGADVPYELFAWRQITYDIEPDERSVENILSEGLARVELGEYELKRIVRGNIVDTWFIKSGENEHFDKLMEEISALNEATVENIEKSLKKSLPAVFQEDEINDMLFYHAYVSAKSGLVNIANILFSLREPSKIRDEFLMTMLKKSVYEYFLSAQEEKTAQKPVRVLFEAKKKGGAAFDAQYFIELIESNWVK
jgi:hypothetical protein